MSVCIEKLPHSCGSSDALQVFHNDEDMYTGYCFACDTFVADPYNEHGRGRERKKNPIKKSEAEVAQSIREISSLNAVDLRDRHLDKHSLDYFGVKVGVSEQDGSTPVFHYYPRYRDGEFVGYKARFVPDKKFWSIGDTKGADLFGWEQAAAAGGKKLFITEGECDAIALYQALKKRARGTEYADLDPAVVSLPDGTSSATRAVAKHKNDIRSKFKEVILVFDKDGPGAAATKEVVKAFPEFLTADIPSTDPNQAVIDGRSKALCNAVLFQASKPVNSRLIMAWEIWDEAMKPAEWGMSYPWEGLTDLTRGIRTGETIYLGAGVKIGKSTAMTQIATHLMLNEGQKIFLAGPEEEALNIVKLVAGKAVGEIFHDPKVEFNTDAFLRAKDLVSDKLILLDIYQHLGWETLRSDIAVAVQQGAKAVFIDPITNLTNGIPAADANTKLQEVAQDLAAMSKDLEFTTFLFCHLKAPLAGPPHERGGEVLSYQFAGSRAMMRSCHYMFGLEGNKDPDLPEEEQNLRRLVLLEDRKYGESGYIRLHYNQKTGLMSELRER